jgi:phosphatidylinositol alpha-1,6-mannosyltransferase
VTVPGRLPGSRQLLGRVLRGARHVIAAGGYPAAEGIRAAGVELPVTVVPPGVDTDRFRPSSPEERRATRSRFGIPADAELILGLSRLVPRKGFDTAIRAVARLTRIRPRLELAIAGGGRDAERLQRLASSLGAPVRFLGRVADHDLVPLFGAADLYTMLCRNRWGGLEQEGFGIVFLEAAACGVPQVAGDSGGSAEAVEDGVTGIVVRPSDDPDAVARAFVELLDDPLRRHEMAVAGRERAEREFSYDVLARRLGEALGALS